MLALRKTFFAGLGLSFTLLLCQQAQAAPIPSTAYWLNSHTLAWEPPLSAKAQTSVYLCQDPLAQLYLENRKHRGGQCQALRAQGKLQNHPTLKNRVPHLNHLNLYALPENWAQTSEKLLQNQLWLELRNAQTQEVLAHSGLQLAEILDQEYSYSGNDLGLSFSSSGVPQFKLWAPTAQTVELEIFRPDQLAQAAETLPLQKGPSGTWSLSDPAEWKNLYYRYRVKAYRADTGRIETHSVTDPYSVSLAADSTHSQIVDLQAPELKPAGWDSLVLPTLEAPEDAVLYELHLRDFSISDPSVPPEARGKYAAFSLPDSNGVKHLRQLAQSGLSHVHLLPVFDIATIPERFARQPQIPAAPPDSDRQQDALALVRDKDGFNWGYDPLHYGVPEGSYASDPQGSKRILEFRLMVKSLAEMGLRTVMDVVYNHTHAAGPVPLSVLDKIVPGYYYRLDAQGQIQNTTCCPDTASEHLMMEKLMRETLLRWATAYKISGFRFDLMGHHSTQNLKKIRADLDALTPETAGIQGQEILLYGEGWKFGSLDAIQPQNAMNQVAGSGLGVGMFNDRLRDSARGGNYDHSTRSDQGFATGLYTDPNLSAFNRDTPTETQAQKALLLNYADNLRVGLTGGLKDYRFESAQGQEVSGQEILYRGSPGSGFARDPQESINYVSAHDNYALWDQIAAKAPFRTPDRQPATASAEERMQMQVLALSLPLLGQGIPFLHAGSELLRSKSGDGDSYDSGDWFNLVDWRGLQQNWGVGLPPAWRNEQEWDFWHPRLTQTEFKASQVQMLTALAQVHRLLQVRRSSALFRLRSLEEIQARVRFRNTGPNQVPGLIAMEIRDDLPDHTNLDPLRKRILVFWNANRGTQWFCQPDWKDLKFEAYSRSGEGPLLERSLPLQVGGQDWVLAPPAFLHTEKLPSNHQAGSACFAIPSRATLVYHERENLLGD